jgi:drug/metabolite transporter (DMT)-like permease
MRRRVVGAALTVVGILMVLFAPAWGVTSCPSCIAINDPACGCQKFTDSLVVPMRWSGDWAKLFFPMAVIGVALVVTGVVLVVKRSRSTRSSLVG